MGVHRCYWCTGCDKDGDEDSGKDGDKDGNDDKDDVVGDHLVVAVDVLFSQVRVLLLELLQLVGHPVLVGMVVSMVTKLMNIFYRAL